MTLFRFGLAVVLLPASLSAQSTASTCTGLCQQQVQCPNGGDTTITGTVYAPNGVDPIPNVTVYIPNATVDAMPAGVSCPVPGALPSGSPLVGAFSSADGTFILNNVPVGTNIPLVIVAGKWRRQLTVPATTACTNTVASGVRFPTNQGEGDIPKFAVSTGAADQVECVLRKVGIADSEFTNLGGSGRIQLVLAAGAPGARIDSGTVSANAVMGDSATLNTFDVLMLPCEGGAFPEPAIQMSNLVSYANAGGRVYASHFAYEWMYKNPPFDTVAQWRGTSSTLPDGPATVNQNFGSGITLSKWLSVVNASTTPGQITVQTTKQDINGVNPPTQTWLTLNSPSAIMQFTFATPVGQTANQCGRVLFNEYHVENNGTSTNKIFPAECTAAAMTPQEKLLEYSLFDLSNNGGPATMTPVSADFGNQPVGYTSASQTFTVTNNSVFTSTLSSISATGDFLVTGNTCSAVTAGSTCTLSVAFKPADLGARTGSLAVNFAGTSLAAALTGTGVPAFSTSTTSLNFGSLDVGASASQTILITNLAPGPLDMPALNVSGDYKATTSCPNSIPVGGSCQVTLTFTPSTTGTRAGSVNAANGTVIALTGNGMDFSMKSSSPSDTIVAGLPDTFTLTASSISGFNAPVTLTCSTTAPATSCAIANTSFTLNGDVSTKVTLSTTAQYTLAGYGYASLWGGLLGSLSVLGIFGLRRRLPVFTRMCLACASLWVIAVAVTGCSGKTPAQNATYTPAGAYAVTIKGTDGFLVHTITYQLTVKSH